MSQTVPTMTGAEFNEVIVWLGVEFLQMASTPKNRYLQLDANDMDVMDKILLRRFVEEKKQQALPKVINDRLLRHGVKAELDRMGEAITRDELKNGHVYRKLRLTKQAAISHPPLKYSDMLALVDAMTLKVKFVNFCVMDTYRRQLDNMSLFCRELGSLFQNIANEIREVFSSVMITFILFHTGIEALEQGRIDAERKCISLVRVVQSLSDYQHDEEDEYSLFGSAIDHDEENVAEDDEVNQVSKNTPPPSQDHPEVGTQVCFQSWVLVLLLSNSYSSIDRSFSSQQSSDIDTNTNDIDVDTVSQIPSISMSSGFFDIKEQGDKMAKQRRLQKKLATSGKAVAALTHSVSTTQAKTQFDIFSTMFKEMMGSLRDKDASNKAMIDAMEREMEANLTKARERFLEQATSSRRAAKDKSPRAVENAIARSGFEEIRHVEKIEQEIAALQVEMNVL